MRRFGVLFIGLLIMPGVVSAHAGHWVDVAGHDHLLAGAAIGIAIAIGLAGALKGRGDARVEDEDTQDDDPEPSEA